MLHMKACLTPPSFRLAVLLLSTVVTRMCAGQPPRFYVPADADYTIVQSALDSLRFTLEKTLETDSRNHLVSRSSFVDPEGRIMGWHDFGHLEGPGWAANAVGGAWEIFSAGEFFARADWQSNGLAILDHVLDCGFIDTNSGFIRGYRHKTNDSFCLNYKHNSDWFCPGSMAKIGYQMLRFADDLGPDPRARRLREAALKCAGWIERNVETVPNGWFPRRCDSAGRVVRRSPDGGNDRFWESSADSLFILQLQAALTERGLADYRLPLRQKVEVFMRAGGIFGSINHDTYDPHENVAYSVAFRTLLLAARILGEPAIRDFAYNVCLKGLDQFKMHEDRNGVATKGLLYMEKSWDTAYLWENAEAALALFEAVLDSRRSHPRQSRAWELDGLVILRAIARHHYGPHGFLTEGVDWNDHVGQQHHINGEKYGAIQYTEPFLNNQHIVEPTLFYLRHLATVRKTAEGSRWLDVEHNELLVRRSGLR